ncbi:MAG: NUDIX domain-containing protein [Clostridia bacterium]|nr:NUDIX domain-containing protein [Clostridia bacterium]
MKEFFDLYDEHRNPLGRTHERGVPLNDGEYHLVVACWTINSKGQILITHRDPVKKSYPSTWENTCGCAQAGEDSITAIIREMREETGIQTCKNDFVLLGTSVEAHAFIDTYLLKRDVEISDIVLQEGETNDVGWVYADEIDALIDDGIFAYPVVVRLAPLRMAMNQALAESTDRLFKL